MTFEPETSYNPALHIVLAIITLCFLLRALYPLPKLSPEQQRYNDSTLLIIQRMDVGR